MQMPFTFLYPWLLTIIVLVPAILWLRRKRQRTVPHSNVSLHANLRASPLPGLLPQVLLSLGLILLTVALARPVLPQATEQRTIETRDIIMAVDISGSMTSSIDGERKTKTLPDGTEKPINRRIDAARDAGVAFIQARTNDRIGVLVFDDDSYWHWPLSEDHRIVERKGHLLNSHTGGGTNFDGPSEWSSGMGPLQSAINHFKEYGKAESKIMVLITDGADDMNQKRAADLALIMEKMDIKLYVLGIDWESADNDLASFTRQVGGQVFSVADSAGLQQAFSEIDRLETSQIQVEKSVSYKDLYQYFVLLSVICLVLYLASSVVTREEA